MSVPEGATVPGPGPASRAAQLSVTVTDLVDRTVVRAHGQLYEADGVLLQRIATDLTRSGSRRVELDLAGITAADVAGVRALIDLHASLEQAGVDLVFCNANPDLYPVDWHPVPRTDFGGHRAWERPTPD
jgi:anti-anti-sigma regulatory factor